MMIFNTSKSPQEENENKMDFSMIKKYIPIFFVLLIIFTIIYFTCFGCFLILNDPAPQTVTLSSEGPAYMTYPDDMGDYQAADEGIEFFGGDGSLSFYNWYRHKVKKDRFLKYNVDGIIVC